MNDPEHYCMCSLQHPVLYLSLVFSPVSVFVLLQETEWLPLCAVFLLLIVKKAAHYICKPLEYISFG